jgi:ribosomal RNA assembly protein
MRYLKIPLERIGVLIGKNGEIKKYLESKSGLKIDIDSEQGEIVLDEHKAEDPLMLIKIENIITAIGRGFSPQNAFLLFNDDADFFVFDLYDYVGRKETHVKRLKSRIIGSEGKTKRVLESLTGSKISVYGHTISILSDIIKMNVMKKSIDMLLTGSKHATVYRFVENEIKKLKNAEKMGF